MGKIRPYYIKDACKRILKRYPDKVTEDFELNKEFLREYVDISSITLRNKIAGYLVTLKKNSGRTIIPPKREKKIKSKKDKPKKQKKKWIE